MFVYVCRVLYVCVLQCDGIQREDCSHYSLSLMLDLCVCINLSLWFYGFSVYCMFLFYLEITLISDGDVLICAVSITLIVYYEKFV